MDKKITLKKKVYDEVFKDIIQGIYKSGDIISEVSLVEKYGVSKAPVREALVELCNESVLRSIPRYGYEIIPVTRNDIKNLQEFRQIIECTCLRENWSCFTLNGLKQLEKLSEFAPMTPSFDDITKLWENNSEFHLTLMSFYSNKYIYDELGKALRVLTRAFAQMYWDKWSGTTLIAEENLEHRELIRLIKNNDVDGAVNCLKRDIIEIT
ncbi:MAG: GntR family transcriptional regulator [Oscillospiraceae bacterium]